MLGLLLLASSVLCVMMTPDFLQGAVHAACLDCRRTGAGVMATPRPFMRIEAANLESRGSIAAAMALSPFLRAEVPKP
jgi:hypothetical protein